MRSSSESDGVLKSLPSGARPFLLGFVLGSIVAAMVVARPDRPYQASNDVVEVKRGVESSPVAVVPNIPDVGVPSWVFDRINKVEEPEVREKCLAVVRGTGTFSQAYQDTVMFQNFFKGMDGPGVYLDIGGNDARDISNSYFFDKCLGWKGVVVEPNPQYVAGYAKYRTARLLSNCAGTRENQKVTFNFEGFGGHIAQTSGGQTTCLTLAQILRDNADILGAQDPETGAWGTKLNFVSLDVEGYEVNILGCSDLTALFSSKPKIQVWVIENNHASGHQLRTIDAAMGLGGYVKIAPNLQHDRSFLDDIYVQHRDILKNYRPPQFSCRSKTASCSVTDIFVPNGDLIGHEANC